uniref:Uncharacterized protein n=1 Tax=Anopheles stephensi TaxID=30069 RepID=A0A182Y5B8_ANOST
MSTCRACLQKEADEYCSLFKKIHHVTLQEMYHSLTGLSVSPKDGLPCCVCQECADFIVTCNNFRKKCLKSDAQLRSALSQDKDEDELLRVEEYECLEADSDQQTQINIYFEETIMPEEADCSEEIEPNVQELTTIPTENDTTEEPIEDESAYNLYEVTGEEEIVEKVISEEIVQSEFGESYEVVYESTEYLEQPQQSADEAEEPPPVVRCCGCPTLQIDTMEDLKQHSLDVHKQASTVSSVRPYECDICFRRFTKSDLLLRHKATIYERSKRYDCKQCEASFRSRTALHSHNKSKHVCKRTYVCDVCQKGFFTSSTLLSHRQVHGEKKFQCDKCPKMFIRHSDLVIHQTTHSSERPYGCSVCEMRFKTAAHLRGHQAVHTGERSKKCRTCGKGFTTYSDRRVHELQHENIHPFKCDFCDKTYGRNYKLQVHIRKVHTGERPFACGDCSLRFFQRWELTAHRRVDHGEEDGMELSM